MSSFDLKMICFPGAPNLPIFVAQEKGYFAEAGLNVDVSTTPSSAFQAERLASGDFHIAGTAFDNVVAYREGQGAVKFETPPDFFAFMGATQVELAFIVAPEIRDYPDLKGKSLALDALATGFAFVLYEMLARAGLSREDYSLAAVGATPQRWESVKNGSHVGTISIEPFTSIAKSQGFKVLGSSSDLFPVYQGGSFAARRAWAHAHPDVVKGYINGYLTALAWTLAPQNREEATRILLSKMPEIKPVIAKTVMDSLLSPRSGLTPKGAILEDGVRVVLDLRSRYGGGPPLKDPTRYIDLSFYDEVAH